jgi:hypothetical protein
MLNFAEEKLLSKIISFGAFFTTVFVISGSVTDPVNVTKLVSLGVISFAALGVLSTSSILVKFRESILIWAALGIFLAASITSVLMSDSPISQGIYGSYGRNNGFIAYVFLALVLASAASFRSRESFKRVIKALLAAGILNIVYCLWVILFGDFMGWNNPYGNILGTLGNPNFIGSFLGIFIAAYLAYGLGTTTPKWFKYSLLIVIPLTAFEIYDSHAIQGRIVGVTGIGIVGYFLIKSKFNSAITLSYLAAGAIAGVFALCGALQIGPLTSLIYKTSVSLRGQYWLAGWNTGESHPIFGVGMDGFGDWYRRSRDARSIELPGVNTVVNASHNVPLDMFAFGGWPLFIAYIFIMGLGGWAIIRTTLRVKKFDPIFVGLVTSWVGYQLQSIISINQIGLAIWGWLLTGALIAYEKVTRDSSTVSESEMTITRLRAQKVEQEVKPLLFASMFALAGLVISLPPLTADSKWRSAQVERTVQALEATLEYQYFNPQNSMKYMTNIQTLEQSQLFELAHKYAIEAVKWNPESFELWKLVYLIKNSTPEERAGALRNLKRLDPLNPDVTSVK